MSEAAEAPARRKPIAREAFRQEKAVVWVRNAVIEPHIFNAYDRAQARGDKSHLFQWKRGLKADTLDTELIVTGRSLRFEFKAIGQRVKDDDGQGHMIARLRELQHAADWGCTILELCEFYRKHGVMLATNAEYQAIHYDGLVDSRIARAEAAASPKKKSASRKAGPRYLAPKRMARGMNARGSGMWLRG